MKAVNIQWDTDGDKTIAAQLPAEVDIPDGITGEDAVSDYISETTGYCHTGFELAGNKGKGEKTWEHR